MTAIKMTAITEDGVSMKKGRAALSIRSIILLIFILALLVSVSCFGAIVFTNWISSAKSTAQSTAADINEDIYNRVYALVLRPYHINEVNHKIIKNGMLDLADEKLRDCFFIWTLEEHSAEIYSFSYGTAAGEYYGARRNENGVIEIMRNNADTGGDSWYYSVNEDSTAGELVFRAGQFDPRTRAWYKAALEAGGPVFSPVYKHFVMDDLTVSAAWPVYDEAGELEGVLGTHMLLSDIGTYLVEAVDEFDGIALIFEKDSNVLLANSMGAENFEVLPDGTLERYGIEHIENNDIQNAYMQFKTNSDAPQIRGRDNTRLSLASCALI